MEDADRPSTQRLFYALWPDEKTRAALARLIPAGPGRPIPPAQLHLTLAFLGNQPLAMLPQLSRVLQTVPFPALDLQVDHYGYFARPRILWAGLRPCAALERLLQLQRALMQQLADVLPDLTMGVPHFRPHVTLMRKADPIPHGLASAGPAHGNTLPFAPVAWHADQIALVASTATTAGSAYEILGLRSGSGEDGVGSGGRLRN